MNRSFFKTIRCQILTGVLIVSMADIGLPEPNILVTTVCECSYVADNGQKACGPAIIAVFVLIVGGIMYWGLKKACKKLLDPPTPPPPPPPPPPPKPAGTNTNHTASMKLSQALTQQWLDSQIPVDTLLDTNGTGVAAWNVASLGYLDPSNAVNYSICANFTMQTATNLDGHWDDAFSVVCWTSVNNRNTNTLTVFYLGRTGYTTNGDWVEGTPVLTNYTELSSGMPQPCELPIEITGSQRKFFRLMSVQ